MEIIAIYDSTEFSSVSPTENSYTKFIIDRDSLEIQSLDADSNMLTTTEIEKADAIQLANLILTIYK